MKNLTTINETIEWAEGKREMARKHHLSAQAKGEGWFGNSEYWLGYETALVNLLRMLETPEAPPLPYRSPILQRYQILVSNNDPSYELWDTFEDACAEAENLAKEYPWQEEIKTGMWEASWLKSAENRNGVGVLIHVAEAEEAWLVEATMPDGVLADFSEFTSTYEPARGMFEEFVADYPMALVKLCRKDEDTGQLDEWVVVYDSEHDPVEDYVKEQV